MLPLQKLSEAIAILEKRVEESFALENDYAKAVKVMRVIEPLLPWLPLDFKEKQWPRMQCLQHLLAALWEFQELDSSDSMEAKMSKDPRWKVLGQLMRVIVRAESLASSSSWGGQVWSDAVKKAKDLKTKAQAWVIEELKTQMVSCEKTLHGEVAEPAAKWKKLDMMEWDFVLAFGRAVKRMDNKELMSKIEKLEEVRMCRDSRTTRTSRCSRKSLSL